MDLFGYASHDLTTTWLGSSTGLRLRHVQPTGYVELTRLSRWSGAVGMLVGAASERIEPQLRSVVPDVSRAPVASIRVRTVLEIFGVRRGT